MQTSQLVVGLLSCSACSYCLSWGALLAGRRKSGLYLLGAGWLLTAVLIGINWYACGEPPLGNMYHVLVFLSFCFPPLYLLIAMRDRLDWVAVYFAFVSIVPLLGGMFMERDVYWRRVPALQSPWFVPHVFAYMVSYALAAVAFALTIVGIFKRVRGKSDIAKYSDASYRVMRLAFPFMTFGMLSGALWAEEAWGIYWSWDPKETWSLITWALYLVYFHCRLSPKLRRHAELAQILAFLALLTTFLLVNLLPKLASALHSYA